MAENDPVKRPMRSDDRSKLERVRDELLDVGKNTRRDTRERMNSYGMPEYPDEPGAPDLKEYDVDENYGVYLMKLHEWAVERYAEEVKELKSRQSPDVDQYPQLGHDGPRDRKVREAHSQAILDIAEQLEEVDYWRNQVTLVEEAWDRQ